MSFLRKLFSANKKTDEPITETAEQTCAEVKQTAEVDEYTKVGLSRPITEEEKELVSVIMSAIVSGDNPSATVKIHSIIGIDEEKEAAAVVATAVAASDYPTSAFKLVSVETV